jgi:hypothetical protein
MQVNYIIKHGAPEQAKVRLTGIRHFILASMSDRDTRREPSPVRESPRPDIIIASGSAFATNRDPITCNQTRPTKETRKRKSACPAPA